MKESQAWRTIARRIAEGRWHNRGLCAETHGVLPVRVGMRMGLRVRGHLYDSIDRWDSDLGVYMDEPGIAGPRILAALFLALEAAEEESQA